MIFCPSYCSHLQDLPGDLGQNFISDYIIWEKKCLMISFVSTSSFDIWGGDVSCKMPNANKLPSKKNMQDMLFLETSFPLQSMYVYIPLILICSQEVMTHCLSFTIVSSLSFEAIDSNTRNTEISLTFEFSNLSINRTSDICLPSNILVCLKY